MKMMRAILICIVNYLEMKIDKLAERIACATMLYIRGDGVCVGQRNI